MKLPVILVLVAALVLMVGCCPIGGLGRVVVGSGNLATRDVPASDFVRVDAGSTFQVEIVQGATFAVTVTADDNVLKYLDVGTSGDTLRLHLRSGFSLQRLTLRAKVTMPSLRGVDLSGAARATVSGFRSADSLDIGLSGASSLSGDIQAGDSRADLSGASSLSLSGSGQDLSLGGSGASSADLNSYPVQGATVNLSGASRATVDASGTLNADLSGGSTLEYSGSPTLGRINTSGGSSIRAR